MLIAHVNGEKTMVAALGDVITITAEVSAVINGVYRRLEDESGKNFSREVFRKTLISFLSDEDSPLFEAPSEANTEDGKI